MSRRRILTVLDEPPGGDAVDFVLEAADRLSRRHFDLRYAFLHDGGWLGDALGEKKVRVYQMGLGSRSFFGTAWAVRRLVRGTEVDLVHTHEPGTARVAALACWGRCPVLISTHGLPREEGWSGWLARWALEAKHSVVTAASEEARVRWEEETEVRVERVLPPMIDVAALRRRVEDEDRDRSRTRLGFGPDHFVILHVGSFEPGAGQENLLHAFHLARNERTELRLVLGGEGPRLSDARWLAEDLGLEDTVMFLGPVEDRAPFLRAADLWIQPGAPFTSVGELLRALAVGLPVLAPDTPSVRGLAGDGGAVFLDTGRPEETARMILELADDEGQRRTVASGARDAATSRAVGSGPDEVAELYRSILD